MGCYIEKATQHPFLVLFPEGLAGDGSLPFACTSTRLFPLMYKSQVTDQQVFLLFHTHKQLCIILDKTRNKALHLKLPPFYFLGCV